VANTPAKRSTAIILQKLLISHRLWSTSAAAENCWRPFELQDGVLLPRICILDVYKKNFLFDFKKNFYLSDMI
jgi:hypothetical protein